RDYITNIAKNKSNRTKTPTANINPYTRPNLPPNPISRQEAGPPRYWLSSLCLYTCAKVDSAKAEPAPKNAISHIQNTAPGPPIKMAVDTPTIFPVPTRPAKDTAIAWKLEIPSSDFSPLSIKRTISLMYLTWKNFILIEKYKPEITSRTGSGQLQTISFKNDTIVSIV